MQIWAICLANGTGVWYEPYCGRDTSIEDRELGQGPNVVLDLIRKASLEAGCEVFMDNLFMTVPLLQELSSLGIAGTGTMRQNRLNKVPLPKKKEMEKKTVARGTSMAVYQEDRAVVVWRDNKAVYMASNKYDAETKSSCKRFCRVKRASIAVPIPAMVSEYNQSMGGVDLLDNLVACYR